MAKYIQYAGSPDIFEGETGKKLSYEEAQRAGLFKPEQQAFGGGMLSRDVEIVNTPRPEIKKETDFSLYAGLPLAFDVKLPTGPINADILHTEPFNLPDAYDTSISFNAFIDSMGKLDKEREKEIEKLSDVLAQLSKREEKLKEEETKLGIPTDIELLKNLNLQIAQKTQEFLRQQAEITKKPISTPLMNIQSAAVQRQQALEIGMLQAEREARMGNIQLSMDIAKRTVDLEFEPLENEIKRIELFLKLNQGAFDRKERLLSSALQLMVDERKKQLAAQKINKENNLKLRMNIIEAGGDPNIIDINDAYENNQIKAAPYLKKKENLLAGLSPAQQTALFKFRDDYLKESQKTSDMASAFNRVIAAAKNPTAGGSLAVIFGFMKVLDPTSVVREGEQATAENAKGVPERIRNFYNRIITGEKLTENQINDFVQVVTDLFNEQLAIQDTINNRYKNIASQFGIPEEFIITDFRAGTILEPLTEDEQKVDDILNSLLGMTTEKTAQPERLFKTTTLDEVNLPEYLNRFFRQPNTTNPSMPVVSPLTTPDLQTTPPSIITKPPKATEPIIINNVNLQKLMDAIGYYESGGDYKAVGKPNSKGQRAYGKYQIMDFNIPKWTKEVFGKPMTIQEFLNNPIAQDAVARRKLAQYLVEYGNLEDASSAWFTNQPLLKGKGKKDVLGTSGKKYVASIRAIYNRI